MYVVIVGAGGVGQYLAGILVEEGHDVAVVEQNEKTAQRLEKNLDAIVVVGNGASTRALNDAGIRRADLFIAVTNLDEINMFSCLAAKKLGRPQTIARIEDRRYHGDTYTLTASDLDIDFTIGAEQAVSEHTARLYRFPGLSSYERLADGKLALIENRVTERTTGIDQPLTTLTLPGPGNLVAIRREQEFIIPRGDTLLREGDHVFTLTTPDRIEDFLRFYGAPRLDLNKILIIGGGAIGFHAARYLEDLGLAITVIEANPDRARWIAQRLHHAIVLEEDGTDIDVIREHVEEGSDAIMVLMKEDAKALLVAMYAKHIGGRQVVCRVDDLDYAPIAYKMGIDSLVSPQRALAQAILERVRRGKVASAMMLGDNQVEILEFFVPAGGKPGLTDVPIARVGLPSGCLLGGILRTGETSRVLIPRGSDTIRPGDRVILSVHPSALDSVEEVFA